ncbi:SPOR domain-containing protein [Sphingobium boeckii]|uniref:Flp pilus assembly protein TadD n=1 Tax=Sphingobium boeckii TaxID=1082345 RepID=A0A7W9AKR7_9SPHN|nr:tetratricopeptide repeat protein [Sphingobium boeckii]MBB5687465.1 Flp pilus assembly protein TadD [Sphingobium boeckii]
MKSTTVFKLAASALVLGGTLVTPNPMGIISGFASANDTSKMEKSAVDAAAKAQKALKAKDSVKAIAAAEQAVEAEPGNAAYRALLAQSYLQGGRLFSAETTFKDALTLNPEDGRATLSLALVQIALGEPEKGLETLNASRVPVAPADHGLALALAGDTQAAITLLDAAAREQGASAKVRQNLALSHALAGQWRQARAIAAQDVPADQLDRRMLMWAGFANPRNSWEQVASLLGVNPVRDAGQPQRLALNTAPSAQIAEAAPVAEPAVEMAAVEPQAPVETAVPVTYAAAEPAPVSEMARTTNLQQVLFAPRREVLQPLPARYVSTPIKPQYAARAPRATAGQFVVQLGAFSTEARAEAAWKGAVGRFGLSSNTANGTTYRAGNATLHRAAVGGFATRQDAARVCAAVKAKGGTCFVRAATDETPALWAQRISGVRIAAR